MKLKTLTQEQMDAKEPGLFGIEMLGELIPAESGENKVITTSDGTKVALLKDVLVSSNTVLGTVVANGVKKEQATIGFLQVGDEYVPVLDSSECRSAIYRTVGYVECYKDGALIGYVRVVRKNVLIIVIPAAILLIGGLLALFLVLNQQPAVAPQPTDPVAVDDILDGEIPTGDPALILEALKKKVEESKFEVKINSSISVNPSSGKYNVMISNTGRNIHSCYVEIRLKSDKTLLYKSPVLNPGQYIPEATLFEQLPDGVYDAVATFHVVKTDDPSVYLGKVLVDLKVHVGKGDKD